MLSLLFNPVFVQLNFYEGLADKINVLILNIMPKVDEELKRGILKA